MILNIHLSKMSTTRLNLAKIVEKTEGFSGAELKATTVESGMIAIREGRSKVRQDDLRLALKGSRRRERQTVFHLHLMLCMVDKLTMLSVASTHLSSLSVCLISLRAGIK